MDFYNNLPLLDFLYKKVKIGFIKTDIISIVLSLYALFLFVVSFFIYHESLMTISWLLLIPASLKWGVSGSLFSVTYIFGLTILSIMSSEEYDLFHILNIHISGRFVIYLLIGIGLSKLLKEIQENRNRLSVTLNSIGDAVIATNNQGLITKMNPLAEELTGWKFIDAKDRHISEVLKIVNAKTRNSVTNPVKKVLSLGKVVGLANHTILISKDGTEYQISDSASPINDEKGNILGVVMVFRDVTEKYEKEQRIKESEKKYRTLINKSPVGIFRSTSDGQLLMVNPALTRILGCSSVKETLQKYNNLGKNLYVNEDYRKELIKELKQNEEISNFEFTAKKTDGTHIWLTITARISEKNTDGSFIIDGFMTDITEKKANEEILIEKEKELRAIYENAPIIMILVDEERRIRKVNNYATEFARSSMTEMIGKKSGEALRCIHALDDPEGCEFGSHCKQCIVRQTILDTLNTGESHSHVEAEMVFNNKFENKESNLLLFTTRLNIKQERLVLVSILDITERKQVEQKNEYMSFHDTLTDLYNRAFLDVEMKRLDTKRQLPMSIIMGDLNGLKLINDAYGHIVGDKVLVKTAEIFKKSCRSEDIITRWGGDEFLVLLPQTSQKEAELITKRIKNNCKETEHEAVPVSIALGVGVKEDPGETIDNVFKVAEDRMYRNKLTESKSIKGEVLKAILSTLKEKSNETEKHARRLQEMSLQLASGVGLSSSELDKLKLLSSLHDIGKIVIPEKILNKVEKLTDEEWELIKEHPEKGYRIASSTEEFAHIANDILHHHERWDGTGYPSGLEGEDIPILSRIIAVIDAYDVMTKGRIYKDPMPVEEAISELKRCAGTQFDPNIVQIFSDIVVEKEQM